MIERVKKQLAGWPKRYLSKWGKEVVIKSTLSSIPTYFMSLLKVPKKMAEGLKRL